MLSTYTFTFMFDCTLGLIYILVHLPTYVLTYAFESPNAHASREPCVYLVSRAPPSGLPTFTPQSSSRRWRSSCRVHPSACSAASASVHQPVRPSAHLPARKADVPGQPCTGSSAHPPVRSAGRRLGWATCPRARLLGGPLISSAGLLARFLVSPLTHPSVGPAPSLDAPYPLPEPHRAD